MKKLQNRNAVSAAQIAAKAVLRSRLYQHCTFKVLCWEAEASAHAEAEVGDRGEWAASMAAHLRAAMTIVERAAVGVADATALEEAVSEMLDESITVTEGLDELMRPVK